MCSCLIELASAPSTDLLHFYFIMKFIRLVLSMCGPLQKIKLFDDRKFALLQCSCRYVADMRRFTIKNLQWKKSLLYCSFILLLLQLCGRLNTSVILTAGVMHNCTSPSVVTCHRGMPSASAACIAQHTFSYRSRYDHLYVKHRWKYLHVNCYPFGDDRDNLKFNRKLRH